MWQDKVTRVKRLTQKVIDKASPGRRAERAAFSALRKRFYTAYWENAAASIGADIEDMGNGFWQIRKGNAVTFVHNERVMLDNPVILALVGDKALVYRLLAEDHCPVPRSQVFTLDTINKAFEFQQKTAGAVVVKPMDSWAGQGVTVNIKTAETLQQAASFAAQFGEKLLVENHIAGDSYRLLFLNGDFIDAVRRDSPQITGDGKSTIKQLVAAENASRVSGQEITALSALRIDADCKRTLQESGFSLQSVLPENKTIRVKKVANHNSRYENHSVTKQVHPEIIQLGSEIASRYRIELAGLDIITTDISKPLAATSGVINEINTTPGLHHHALISKPDEAAPVGGMVLDYILRHYPIER